MKKILTILTLALLLPSLALAAFNDVTLTTDVIVTSNGNSVNVYGTSAVLESITVDSGSFTVSLASGSSIEIQSTDRKSIDVSSPSFITTNICSATESRIKLEITGASVSITVTPLSATCQGLANTAAGTGGGGGPAPQCEDSIDNDKDGLIDLKDPGCKNSADNDETNTTPAVATTTTPVATTTPTTTSPPTTVAQTAAAAASPEVQSLINQLRSLIALLKSLGGTVSPALEETINALSPSMPTAFARDLKVGSTGENVKTLQIFLNTHGYIVASIGPGSVGNETTLFGAATRAALIKFQKANNITPAAGYFGPKTRAFVNSMK